VSSVPSRDTRSPWARLRTASLGAKLIIFSALLSALMVSVTFVVLSLEVRGHTRDLLAQTLAQHQRMLGDLQTRSLGELLRASTLMSDSPTLLAAMETYREEAAFNHGRDVRADLLGTIQMEVDKIAGGLATDLLVVTGPDGRVLARSGRPAEVPAVGEDLSGRVVVRHALAQQTPVSSRNTAVMGLHGQHFQVGCVPILLQGYIVGSLTIGHRLDQVYVEGLRQSLGTHVAVMTEADILGSTLPGLQHEAAATTPASTEQTSVLAVGKEDFVSVPLTLGLDERGRPVSLFLLRSLTSDLARSNRSLLVTMVGYGLLVVLVTGLSASLVSRSVLRPLKSLVAFMRSSAESGDRSRRFESPAAAAEVQVLATTFNHLMSSLQEHEQRLLDKAREDLERLDRFKESEKLASLGRMLSGAAHEINNPMTGVIGHIELLLQMQALDPDVRRRLEEVRKQGHRIVALTRNLLRVARRGDGRRAHVDVNQIIRDTIALRQRDYERAGIALTLDLSPKPVMLLASDLELSQVFINIINNAYDALHETPHAETRQLRITTTDAPDGATVVFADNGPGMKDASQVFEHFYTTKPPGQGTGLGLGIAQAVVESHGGRIVAQNRDGGGAQFTISLPRGAQQAVQPTASEPADVPLSRRPLPASILVVDDEPVVRELQMAILDSLGAKVVAAPSGAEAIAQMQRQDFDLIVADLTMEGAVSGAALYDWMTRNRRRGSQGIVLVLEGTGNGAPSVPEKQQQRCLMKPFEMGEYVSVLREAFDELQ